MTDRAEPGSREAAEVLAREASRAVSAAVVRIARQLGTQTAVVPGGVACPRAPGAALRISRQLELAARGEVRAHIRRAREAGQSWHEIGGVLGFGAFAVDGVGAKVAEWAFDCATGPRAANGWFDAPVFPWNCAVRAWADKVSSQPSAPQAARDLAESVRRAHRRPDGWSSVRPGETRIVAGRTDDQSTDRR